MPRVPRPLRPLVRPALAVVLVVAQAVAAFGFPVVRARNVRACGCVAPCGTAPGCCCRPPAAPPPACPSCAARDRAAPAETEPGVVVYLVGEDAPARDCCTTGGGCCTARTPAPADVTWVAAAKARECRGETPGAVFAESPAVPPVVPVHAAGAAAVAFPPPAGAGDPHFVTDPSDPPPRG